MKSSVIRPATLAITLALCAIALASYQLAPGVWAELTTDASIANAIISVLGALLGTVIAIAAAYAILTRQVSADRQLEMDMRLADVAHEVAGEISFWRVSLPEPGRGEKSDAYEPELVRALVQRRDRLERAGIPILTILSFVRAVERDRRSLDSSYESIVKRKPADPSDPSDWIEVAATTLQTGLAVSAEWEACVLTHADALDRFATDLSAWQPGLRVPGLSLPGARSLVCTTVELERRLSAAGLTIPRDPIAEQFGLYNDGSADEEGG